MNVGTRVEGLEETLFTRDDCGDAQLYLPKVGDHEAPSGRCAEAGAEGLRARDVLQLWLAAGHAAGRRAGDPECRVNAAGRRSDVLGESIAVGGDEFVSLAVLE